MMDTSAGPDPGLRSRADRDRRADVALNEGKDALKELLDVAAALETPAYERVLAERPGYQEFEDRKWADLSAMMWATMARELGVPVRRPAALARRCACPLLVLVGEQDKPFVVASQRDGRRDPGRASSS